MTPAQQRARTGTAIAAAFWIAGMLLRVEPSRVDLMMVVAAIMTAAMLIVDAIAEATDAAKRDCASAPSASARGGEAAAQVEPGEMGRSPSDASGVGATGEESKNG